MIQKMFRLMILGGLILVAGLAAAQNKKLPSVQLKTLDGKSINIQEFGQKGKPVVLNFWATWCSPCKKELDEIAGDYGDWQKKYGVEIVAISIDDARTLPKVKPLVTQKNWKYTILSDVNSDLKRALNFVNVPQTFLVDKNGNIVYTHSGYSPGDEDELEKKIKEVASK